MAREPGGGLLTDLLRAQVQPLYGGLIAQGLGTKVKSSGVDVKSSGFKLLPRTIA